ncbi:hypothetical protein JHK82_021011 [Glycine max]|nr:hypothetical protein JHK85_021459 [Glycine max]KAG5025110.1 hypothetical protein JHK86_021024 [Glycine max]KAG5136280.1 hypothetical protein JHK82_021011 [Glycine max]
MMNFDGFQKAIEERLEGIPVASEEFLLVSGSSSSASARTTPRLSSARLRLLTPTRARALKRGKNLASLPVAFLVFQFSRNLILKSQSKRFRPLFSRKEDLENTLKSAAREQNKLNSTMRKGDIQVATLEDVIKEMKENSTSNWDDVIFIPPGFDVSDDSNEQ